MKIIGLCGGSGSGKGTVCDIFRTLGIPSVDTDAVYHQLTSGPSDCLEALKNEFGDSIVSESGSLNRRALAAIVFSEDGNGERLNTLNTIAHKFILNEARKRLESFASEGFEYAIVDAPLLYESGFDKECNVIIGVIADFETRIERIMLRDGISREAASNRIAAQMTDEELINRCDFIISNDSDIDSLDKKVTEVLNKIR